MPQTTMDEFDRIIQEANRIESNQSSRGIVEWRNLSRSARFNRSCVVFTLRIRDLVGRPIPYTDVTRLLNRAAAIDRYHNKEEITPADARRLKREELAAKKICNPLGLKAHRPGEPDKPPLFISLQSYKPRPRLQSSGSDLIAVPAPFIVGRDTIYFPDLR